LVRKEERKGKKKKKEKRKMKKKEAKGSGLHRSPHPRKNFLSRNSSAVTCLGSAGLTCREGEKEKGEGKKEGIAKEKLRTAP